jgi:hypothetical protein
MPPPGTNSCRRRGRASTKSRRRPSSKFWKV